MGEKSNIPEINRLSIIIAPILLVYTIIPFVNIPHNSIRLDFPGLIFPFEFDLSILIYILVAVMAALGSDWLLHDHPKLNNRSTIQHWILPSLTTWVIGIPLNSLDIDWQYWVIFTFGGILLFIVFTAEYIIVDPNDIYQSLAAIGLTAISLALFLILAISIRTNGVRLYLALPAIFIATGMIVLRTNYLRSGGRWTFVWGFCAAIIVSQLAVGLHYLPLKPLAYGVSLLGPIYGLIEFADAFESGASPRLIWVGPSASMVIFLIIAYISNL